jgi:N-acetyl-anhydromuramyl-L-alanine amidase AmpD
MAFDTSKKCKYNSGAMSKSDVKYIVFHRTEGHIAGDLSTLMSGGGRKVSIHFLIAPTGKIYKMLPMYKGANHAGYGDSGLAAKYGNANHHAYGIELSGMGSEPYTTAQLKALDEVVKYIDSYLGRKVPITSHAAIDPERKSDPRHFPYFDNYNRYRSFKKPVAPVMYRCTKTHKARKEATGGSASFIGAKFVEGKYYRYANVKRNGFIRFYVRTITGKVVQAYGYAHLFDKV